MKVLFFDFRESEKEFFEENKFCDFEFKFFSESLGEKTKLSENEYNETDVISVYRSSLLSSDVLKKFKNLRIIATRTFGFSHIDLNYCKNNGIAVLHTEQYGDNAISEYALGLIIALSRKIRPALLDIKNNRVIPHKYEGKLLKDLSIGIIGCGKVGNKLANLANFFGMKVYVSSYKDMEQNETIYNIVPFDKLLRESDIISLHMPFTTETYQILGNEEFSRMKEGVYIINTSCAELIDLEVLYKNIKSGKVKGAGLDILDYSKEKAKYFKNEIEISKEKIISKLLDMENVIITPHIAYNTTDSINYILHTTINNIRDLRKGMNTNRVC